MNCEISRVQEPVTWRINALKWSNNDWNRFPGLTRGIQCSLRPMTNRLLCLALLFFTHSLLGSLPKNTRCTWIKNITESKDYDSDLKITGIDELEDCLYYYLLDREYEKTGDFHSLEHESPPEKPLRVEIENVIIHHVELRPQSTYQFRIQGDIYLNWEDDRLSWDLIQWKIDQFQLHDGHHIWAPKLKDHSMCEDGDTTSCVTSLHDVDILSDGRVYARLHFAYNSLCGIDYTRYPEEENTCCIFFSAFELLADIGFDLQAKDKIPLNKEVGMAKLHREKFEKLYEMEGDHSAWVIDGRTITVEDVLRFQQAETSISKVAAFSTIQVLRVCVHAEKRMSTLRLALRLPVTIATMIMLVSPLFGDLKVQAWVKLLTLSLQTVCFLFLCSIAPPNGFAQTKPKIYTFYETVFTLTLISVVVTVCAMALCRVKRTVPPSHRVYLFAKLVNRLICCVEPEPEISYQRHFDNLEQRIPPTTSPAEGDYTQDWRHIYVAANNLFSGISFTFFVVVAIFDIV